LDFVSKRNWFFLLSFLIILPGVVFLVPPGGLKAGIDFTGGSSIMLQFSMPVDSEDLRLELTDFGETDAVVQSMGDDTFFVRTKELPQERKNALVDLLKARLSPDGVEVLSFDLVSPLIARETVFAAFWAVLAAAVGIYLYLWWAFRTVPSPFRYGTAAIIALLHDTMVVVGIFAILGQLLDTEVNTMFLIALLTVIGYSVNDTIVIFDRIRENILLYPNRDLATVANLSISESLGRSLNTSLTLLFTLLALLLFGGQTIRVFLWVLLIGVIVGTYSSIGIATQVLIVWEYGDLKKLWRKIRRTPATAPEAS